MPPITQSGKKVRPQQPGWTVMHPRSCTTIGFWVSLGCAVGGGCGGEDAGESPKGNGASAPDKPRNVLVFPKELHVGDASVNEFVTEAMTTSASGDYEAFRLLWSAREQPLPREEFEQGWHAVREIRVEALQKVLLDADASAGRSAPQTVYALLAHVSLDPTQKVGQKEPERKAVLVLTRENDRWRLSKAPRELRDWIKNKSSAATAPTSKP